MIWTELVCDRCFDVYGNGTKPAELRRNAARDGWVRVMDHYTYQDYCLACKDALARAGGIKEDAS